MQSCSGKVVEQLKSLKEMIDIFRAKIAEGREKESGSDVFSSVQNSKDVGKKSLNLTLESGPLRSSSSSEMRSAPKKFDAEEDDREVMEMTFRKLGKGMGQRITSEDLERAMMEFPDHQTMWQAMIESLPSRREEGITLETFCSTADNFPRAKGQRLQWVLSLGIVQAFAQHLPAGDLMDPLGSLRDLQPDELDRAICQFAAELPELVRSGHCRLSKQHANQDNQSEAEAVISKFSEAPEAFTARFATLEEFHQGAEALLGQPNPRLREGIQREHLSRPSAQMLFVAPNYGLCSCSAWEYLWCMLPGLDPKTLSERFEGFNASKLKRRLEISNGKYPGQVGDTLIELVVNFNMAGHAGKAISRKQVQAALPAVVQSMVSDGNDEGFARAREVVVFDCAAEGEMCAVLPMAVGQDGMQQSLASRLAAELGLDNSAVVIGSIKEQVWEFVAMSTHSPDSLRKMPWSALLRSLKGWKAAMDVTNEMEAKLVTDALAAMERASGTKELRANESIVELVREALELQTERLKRAGRKLRQGRLWQGALEEWIERLRAVILDLAYEAGMETGGNDLLCDEEIVALILYTGPIYVLYNAVLRGFPAKLVDLLNTGAAKPAGTLSAAGPRAVAGNRFETTIFTISSGIVKLARLTKVPQNRLVYRGMGGALLPEQFWKRSGAAMLQGGVEYGLMSTTTDRSIAVQYSGTKVKRGIVFEIQAGRIDIGASISFLSQYPGEEEYLLPPLSCLEVVSDPRVDQTKEGQVIVVPLRLNVNQRSLTVEMLIQRRKILHLSMSKNLREDLQLAMSKSYEQLKTRAKGENVGAQDAESTCSAGQVVLLRGIESQISVDLSASSIKFSSAKSCMVGAPYLAASEGKFYFELTILERGDNLFGCFGFGGTCIVPSKAPWCVGGDALTWALNGQGIGFHSGNFKIHEENAENKEFEVGTTLGLAWDSTVGSFTVSANGGDWKTNFDQGVSPSLVAGAGLFPVMSGYHGCKLGWNFGQENFKYDPPSAEYCSFLSKWKCNSGLLSQLGISVESLVEVFDSMTTEHRGMKFESFNIDDIYKYRLNEILNLKVGLAKKQNAIYTILLEGARAEHVRLLVPAPALDFLEWRDDLAAHMLSVAPGFTWRSVLAGDAWFRFLDQASVPLGCPPCQAAVVWLCLLGEGSSVSNVKLDEVVQPDLAQLMPALGLQKSGLTVAKYMPAVVGLLLASAQLFQDLHSGTDALAAADVTRHYSTGDRVEGLYRNGNWYPATVAEAQADGRFLLSWDDGDSEDRVKAVDELRPLLAAGAGACGGSRVTVGTVVTEVDVQNLDFSAEGREKLEAAVLACVQGGGLVAINGLSLTGEEANNLNTRLQRSGAALEFAKELSQPCDWLFVGHLLARQECRRLDLSENCLGPEGAEMLLPGLAQLTHLELLNLRKNALGPEGILRICLPLAKLTRLQTLDLSENNMCAQGAAEGAAALSRSLATLTNLQALHLKGDGDSNIDVKGATAIAPTLAMLTNLVQLDLGYNDLICEQGTTAIAPSLAMLTNLAQLDLSFARMGVQGAAVLSPVLAKLTKLQSLDLSGNNLGDEGVATICPALKALLNLQHLDLCENDLGDPSCDYVAAVLPSLHSLTSLEICCNNTQMTQEAEDKMRQAAPPSLAQHYLGNSEPNLAESQSSPKTMAFDVGHLASWT